MKGGNASAVLLLGLWCILLVADLRRAPGDQLTALVLCGGVSFYKEHLSPLTQSLGMRCRFTPSCSTYALEAIRHRGTLHGGFLAVSRLLRCGPWTVQGTVDPAPLSQQ